ncbi:MAG: hypothetical protein ACREPM_03390 [Gemmatimonadaceae bacterium]
MGQPKPKQTPKKLDSCTVIRPWSSAAGDILGPKTASAAYASLETKWAIDSNAARREVTALLSHQPGLAGTLAGAASSCPGKGCVCPVPPKLPQTSQIGESVGLETGYRIDPQGTSAATALFLSKHDWLLRHVYDSLSKVSNKAQLDQLLKGNAAGKNTAMLDARVSRP